MDTRYEVVVSTGTLAVRGDDVVRFPHRWSDGGVTARTQFTGAHLLHLSVAGCVLNDLHREAARLSLELLGVCVTAAGSFDAETWHSTGIEYVVELAADAPQEQLEHLIALVDSLAEIPHAVRAGATVRRVAGTTAGG